MKYGYLFGFGINRGRTSVLAPGSSLEVSFTATKVGPNEAPQSVEFVATATGEGISSQSDVVFLWDFGDTYQFRFLPVDTVSNDRQSGTARGFAAAHVYRSAGTFTVTCTAYIISAGVIAIGSTSQEVVIAASDPRFTERVAISKTGSFTGAPAGATQVDWSGGEPGSFSWNPNTAYYFQNGQTFTTVNLNAVNFSSGEVFKLDGYGAGAPWVFTNAGLIVWGSNQGDIFIGNGEFVGSYDVDDNPDWEDTGEYPTPPTAPRETGLFLIGGGTGNALVFGVKMSGFQINFYPGRPATTKTHFVDCESTNWFDYGCLDASLGATAHVGCRYHQKVGTQPLPAQALGSRAWNTVGVDNTARQGSLRIGDSPLVIVNKCNMLSYRCGWSPGFGGFAAVQAPIRVGTNTIVGTENASISQNDFEGGGSVLALSIQNGSTAQAAIGTFVAEANFLRLDRDGQSQDIITTTKPGAHIRGNIIHFPTGITNVAFTGKPLVFANPALSYAADATSYVYGNTFVSDNNENLSWSVSTQIGAGTRLITYENNMFQLRGTSDVAGSGALFQTNYAPIGATFPFAPTAGSAAYRTYSTGKLPPLEQDGGLRTAPFNLGAT